MIKDCKLILNKMQTNLEDSCKVVNISVEEEKNICPLPSSFSTWGTDTRQNNKGKTEAG